MLPSHCDTWLSKYNVPRLLDGELGNSLLENTSCTALLSWDHPSLTNTTRSMRLTTTEETPCLRPETDEPPHKRQKIAEHEFQTDSQVKTTPVPRFRNEINIMCLLIKEQCRISPLLIAKRSTTKSSITEWLGSDLELFNGGAEEVTAYIWDNQTYHLKAYLQDNGEERQVWTASLQLVETLIELQELNLVHCNLILENCRLDKESVYIDDPGAIITVDSINLACWRATEHLMNPLRLAPEVLISKEAERDYSKQHSFSLGLLIHDMLCGTHAFENYSNFESCASLVRSNASKDLERRFSKEIIELMENLLLVDSEQRWSLEKAREHLKLPYGATATLVSLALEQKQAKDLYEVGQRYRKGIKVMVNVAKAVEFYALAAKQNFPPALHKLGALYALGDGGLPMDKAKAIQYYRSAGEYPPAQCDLAVELISGDNPDGNEVEGFALFERAAAQGHVRSISNCAYCYERGIGVGKDTTKAVELFIQSGELGYSTGLYNVGSCYNTGMGVPRNRKKALDYFRLAASLGLVEAIKKLRELTE